MITLIYGGSGSGKSEFAEDYVCKQTGFEKRYYLATMAASDPESKLRIKKHQNQRDGKGFETIEQPVDIDKATPESNSIVLLECLSNLVANEMFKDGKVIPSKECISKITEDLDTLKGKAGALVIVSNNIYEDGCNYDEFTKDYLRALAAINNHLVQESDEVYEVTVGIPLKIKG